MLPAFQATKTDLIVVERRRRQSKRGPAAAPGTKFLVVTEIALAQVRWWVRLSWLSAMCASRKSIPCFNADKVLTAKIAPSRTSINDPRSAKRYYTAVLERCQAVPGGISGNGNDLR